jgi:D-arabinose 1-dehydrogenase-like Zn-dependent alcohol dehydrogenase
VQGSIDVVIDIVGGSQTVDLLDLLRPGGRYAVAVAIGGPIAEIDLRIVYLKDLSLLGCTVQDHEVFENLVGYIERNEIRPVVCKTYPLSAIAEAQEDFLSKRHTRKLVLLPPSATSAHTTTDTNGTEAVQRKSSQIDLFRPAAAKPKRWISLQRRGALR